MISIRHLQKCFDGITPLRDVNAEIRDGDVICIIGPSGTGKSTLLRCINMLTPPTGGQILVNGVDMTDKKTNLNQIRHKMGMVFQSFNLFSHKMVIENVMMGPMDLFGISKQEAFDEGVRYLKMVGLGEKLYAYPDELSGGQQQRVAIARCLAMKPEIILFDEPTSALDPTMTGEVQGVIRRLKEQGLTMMVVTHDMQFSREIANRIFYMDQGEIYEEGPPEQIFDNPQRERTRAFVKRLQTLEYTVSSRDFDLYELNARIGSFAGKVRMDPRQVRNLELVLEELLLHQLLSHTEDICISIRAYEKDQTVELRLNYGGGDYDPFADEMEDILSMLMVRQLTVGAEHRYDGRNDLTMQIAHIPNQKLD